MNTNFIYFLLIGAFIICMSCESDRPLQAYSIEELEKNEQNDLKLAVEENPDILTLTGELEKLDRAGVEARLQKKGLGLMEASYLFYTLGLRYFQEEDFQNGMKYQKLAADQYLNPLAMIRLAHIYTDSTSSVQKMFPEADLGDFEQDFDKVYHYLHYGLNMAILSMEHFQDNYVVKEANFMSGPLTNLFQARDSSVIGNFDVKAAEAAMKAELPAIREKFEAFYGVGDGSEG